MQEFEDRVEREREREIHFITYSVKYVWEKLIQFEVVQEDKRIKG